MIEGTVDIFQSFLDSRLSGVHTSLPGVIESYDSNKRKAKVKPVVKVAVESDQDTVNIDIPPIENVPVIFPSSGEFSLLFPLKKGDFCLLLFAEAGIGNFLSLSELKSVDADDLSRFSLTDAICIPGLFPFKLVPDKSNFIEIKSNGDIEINATSNIILNGGTDFAVKFNELKTAFDLLVSDFNSHVHPGVTSGGASTGTIIPPSTADMSNSKVERIKL